MYVMSYADHRLAAQIVANWHYGSSTASANQQEQRYSVSVTPYTLVP